VTKFCSAVSLNRTDLYSDSVAHLRQLDPRISRRGCTKILAAPVSRENSCGPVPDIPRVRSKSATALDSPAWNK
jgi:hypothetical protein